ncbi:thiol-disulfide oxidoreductase DCC family protein [Flavobacterium crassostreae]|uniref:Thiol-disulfide oxidoreductase n=1 Tax=Flavobacterium crassostreae TaxID=1763534 RepID=A0A1B9EAA9_9FLAO|nr:DCC1-like thiol-disulfide oxidoreductase family protein [Flavobacterium crassostreae]OCB78870.1 thiol-disulfide oxidoreductase [Flavobacterium crassostreae]
MQNLPQNKKIILFDGVCNLCDTAVQFIHKRDTKDIFRFASLQSKMGQDIIQYLGVAATAPDSIILYEPGIAYYYKSQAALRIAKELRGLQIPALIFSIFPSSWMDYGYTFIAKNRYRWYGQKASCELANPELKAKFID